MINVGSSTRTPCSHASRRCSNSTRPAFPTPTPSCSPLLPTDPGGYPRPACYSPGSPPCIPPPPRPPALTRTPAPTPRHSPPSSSTTSWSLDTAAADHPTHHPLPLLPVPIHHPPSPPAPHHHHQASSSPPPSPPVPHLHPHKPNTPSTPPPPQTKSQTNTPTNPSPPHLYHYHQSQQDQDAPSPPPRSAQAGTPPRSCRAARTDRRGSRSLRRLCRSSLGGGSSGGRTRCTTR